MYNKERVKIIVSEWFEFKTGIILSDETLSKLVDDITKTKEIDTTIDRITLPTKDEVASKGYKIAGYDGYNYRRVLKDKENDIYYSGWMDCYDWISKGGQL